MQILSLSRAGEKATVVYTGERGEIRQTTLAASLTDAEIAAILTPDIPPSPLFGGPPPVSAPQTSSRKRSRRS